jgi:hypothetical protein
VVTVSGRELSPKFEVSRIEALGQSRDSFPVLSHTIPLTNVHGLLGLDFLNQRRLTIDFRAGTIDLG